MNKSLLCRTLLIGATLLAFDSAARGFSVRGGGASMNSLAGAGGVTWLGGLEHYDVSVPDHTVRQLYSRQHYQAMKYGNCLLDLEPSIAVGVTGDYLEGKARLHECAYIRDIVADDCFKTGRCESYRAWTNDNKKDFSPSQPDGVFIYKLDEMLSAPPRPVSDPPLYRKVQ